MAAPAAADIGTETAELIRLAERITYGANRRTLAIAERLGYVGFLDWQLEYEAIDDGGLETALAERLPTLTMDAAALAAFIRDREQLARAQRELTIATLLRQAFSPRQLYERMVEFWNDHFNVAITNLATGFLKPLEDRQVMRPLAMDRFEALLQADAKSPAMLYYLDNHNNTAAGPNENYARELLELHTLGVDGGYTETDIKETARVFTGWTFRRPAEFVFNPRAHDWGPKQVLSLDFPGYGGPAEGERLLGHLAGHDATARHLATKLARRFVADQPGAGLVEATAEAFSTSGGDIRATLRRLLTEPAAREAGAVKLKRPNEYLSGVLRGLEVAPDARRLRRVYRALDDAGQAPFRWPAPNGYPDVRDYWQSSAGFMVRFNTAFEWSRGLAGESALLREAAGVADARQQVEMLAGALVPGGLSPASSRAAADYARTLDPAERPAAVAALLLAGPDNQWR